MHAFRTILAAIAMGAALAACSPPVSGAHQAIKTDAKALEQRIDKLRTATFKASAKGPADFAALAAALPKSLTLTWDKLEFDTASGATVLTGAKLAQAGAAEPLVHIDTLRVWGLDVDLLRARFAGQRLADTAPLARHIEADGVSVQGLGEMMKPFMDAYTKSLTQMAGAAGSRAVDLDLNFSNYDFKVGRLVADDVVLRPWELKPMQVAADGWADVVPGLQAMAAGVRSLAFDTLAYYDTTSSATMTMAGAPSTMKMTLSKIGMRGSRGGDVDFMLARGMKMDMAMTMPASQLAAPLDSDKTKPPAALPAPTAPMALSASLDSETASNVRLEKVLGYFARGVMPPRTETNLLSLGVFTLDGLSETLNGKEFTTVKSVTVDATGFYWLIPTHLRMKQQGMSYNIDGFLSYISEIMKSSGSATPLNVDPRIMEALKRHKLDKPTMDIDFGWDWNATTGATKVDTAFGLHDYFTFDARAEGALPDFKSVSDLIPNGFDTAKQDELGALFKKSFLVKSAEMNLVDKGGLENGFALAIELSALLPPDQQANLGIVKNATPVSLRQLASSGIYAAAGEITKGQPPEQVKAQNDTMRAVAALIDKGGALRLRIKPDKPTAVATLGEGGQTPQQVADALHFTVVNDPPAGAKKN
ncbi:MAG: hypothetical protein ABI740_06825 [Alphaproteobacteria bacterium]